MLGTSALPPFTHTRESVEALPMFTARFPATPVTAEFGLVPLNTLTVGSPFRWVATACIQSRSGPVTPDGGPGTFLG